MDMKKFLLASGAGFVVMFLLSWIGHEYLIASFYEGHPMTQVEAAEPNVMWIIAAYLVIALIMSYMFPKGSEGKGFIGEGLRFGVMVGVLISLPITLIFMGIMDGVPFTSVVAETVWHAIEQGVGGIVIAWFYKGNTASSDE